MSFTWSIFFATIPNSSPNKKQKPSRSMVYIRIEIRTKVMTLSIGPMQALITGKSK